MSEMLELADEGERRTLPSEQCILDRYEHPLVDGKGHWYEGGSHRSKALCLLIKHRGFVDFAQRSASATTREKACCVYDERGVVWADIEELAAQVVVVSYRGPPSNCDPSRWVHYVWTGTEYTPNTPQTIHQAARLGDSALVKRLLIATPGLVNTFGSAQDTPLHIACGLGFNRVVEVLLACPGINLEAGLHESSLPPLYDAVVGRHMKIVQTLIAYGACREIPAEWDEWETRYYDSVASTFGYTDMVHFLRVTREWSVFGVCAVARLHTVLEDLLRTGRCPDPDTIDVFERKIVWMVSKLPSFSGWQWAVPPACKLTQKLIVAMNKGWSPGTHWLHHQNVRTAVHTTLLVAERLGRIKANVVLPPEMWSSIMRCGFTRSGWAV